MKTHNYPQVTPINGQYSNCTTVTLERVYIRILINICQKRCEEDVLKLYGNIFRGHRSDADMVFEYGQYANLVNPSQQTLVHWCVSSFILIEFFEIVSEELKRIFQGSRNLETIFHYLQEE